MEDSWLLSTPMSLNTNTPTLETKETKTQRELFIVIDKMTNTLEHLTGTLDEFKHYIHQAIPAYTEKEEIGMLKSEIETLKE